MKKEKINTQKILIVEDEEPMLQALIDAFENEKLDVLCARDGERGLKIALEEHPDVILADIVMPKMDGLTMLKLIRKDSWGKNVPVIILSNISDINKINEIKEEGICDYLIKTECKLDDIAKKVKKII